MVIALAGNPNVGKSTVFNRLTGLNQHTGNWAGKTVASAQGNYNYEGKKYILVDIPGTYSLMAHSADERAARDFICFGGADAVVVVCDATCLERNLNLLLQTAEICENVILCVNLMDEAKKKRIGIDLKQLERLTGVPVTAVTATSGEGLSELMSVISHIKTAAYHDKPKIITYTNHIEQAISIIEPIVQTKLNGRLNARWLSLKLLEAEPTLLATLSDYLGYSIADDPDVKAAMQQAIDYLSENNISQDFLKDTIISCIIQKAADICASVVSFEKSDYNETDRKIDRLLTGKLTGVPIMLLLLAVIFFLTITVSNYPSQLLSKGLFWFQGQLSIFFNYIAAPLWLSDMLVLGVYRVAAWVVAVMLPPMAIFFPLFTLLEDLGYLPRVAFNLDNQFKKCRTCGKQALTMCME